MEQRRPTGAKGMKLVEENSRTHIHADIINYLTEEGMNIINSTSTIFTCSLHRVFIG